jgi:hypothetical protein
MKIVSFTYEAWPQRGTDEVVYILERVQATVEKALPVNMTTRLEGFATAGDDIQLANDDDFDGECVGFFFAIIEVDRTGETIQDARMNAREAARNELRSAFGKTVRQRKLF